MFFSHSCQFQRKYHPFCWPWPPCYPCSVRRHDRAVDGLICRDVTTASQIYGVLRAHLKWDIERNVTQDT
eukprot:771349-Amorphochlora_amoeboformis.AAC.2